MAIPGDIIQARVRYDLEGGSRCENVYHFRVDGPGGSQSSDASLVLAVESWLDDLYSQMVNVISDGSGVPGVYVDEMQFVAGQWQIFRNIGYMQMTGATWATTQAPLPAGVAALVRAIPIYAKRAGKKYFGGFTIASMDTDGDWTSGFLALMAAVGAELMTTETITASPSNQTLEYVILNRTADLYNVPIEIVASAEPAYQRRRKQGSGF